MNAITAAAAARNLALVLLAWLAVALGLHAFVAVVFTVTAATATGLARGMTQRAIRPAREDSRLRGALVAADRPLNVIPFSGRGSADLVLPGESTDPALGVTA